MGGEKLRTVERLVAGENAMAKVILMKRELTHVQIANRAFEIYVSRGGEHGHDVSDWFEAERQLMTELQPKRAAAQRTRS
jgi:hypothetical protein